METSYGITEYLSPVPGFDCILKERYEDFLVNEIDLNGQVVRLSNCQEKFEEAKASKETSSSVCLDGLLSAEQVEAIDGIVERNQGTVGINVEGKDKEWRKRLHQAVRAKWDGVLETETKGDEITVGKAKSGGRKREHWDSDLGDYCHFTLRKENKDTAQAIALLARLLRINAKSFGIAGTKDRRGITAQRVSVYRVKASRLQSLNKTLREIAIGDFRYEKKQLHLGDLSGNAFALVLRDVKAEKKAVEEAVDMWTKRGFINYFGSQRFGTTAVPTWKIGKEMLLQRWEQAVDLIMQERAEDEKELKECHGLWNETKDPAKALAALSSFKRRSTAEGLILEALKAQGSRNFANAVLSLPRDRRSLYVHSLQSYLWNRVVSRRVKAHGMDVLPGDVVKRGEDYVTLKETEVPEIEAHEIVFPCPGSDVIMPENKTKDWLVEEMEAEGMKLSDFNNESTKQFMLQGSYRQIFIQLKNVEHQLMRYSDPKIPLISTDIKPVKSEEEKGGDKLALILRFSLPPGVYATMALRELIKRDTSKQAQMKYAATESTDDE